MDHEETVMDLMDSDEGIGDEEEDVEEEGGHEKLLETITALDGRKRPVVQRSEPGAVISEFNLSQVGEERVKLHELVTSLKESSSHIALKKQLRAVTRRTRVLNVPLAKPQAERIKREVAYGKVTKELDKWDPIVENNRVADHLEFPLEQPFLGNISTESFVKKFQHHTPLEMEVAKILSGSDHTLTDDRTLTPAEERALKAMSLEEAKERLSELRKARVLLSYKESRARRQNKIKSKGYHRILKRERIRKELKEFEELQKTDPEKAIDRLKDIDKMRIEERMTLKHKNTGKWAKQRMIRAKYDDQSRAALTEQLELSRQLTKKVRAPTDSEEEEDDQTPMAIEGDNKNESEFIHLQTPLTSYNPWMRSSTRKKDEAIVANIPVQLPRVDFGEELLVPVPIDILPDNMCTLGDNVAPETLQDNSSSHEHSGLVTPTSNVPKEAVDSTQAEETTQRTSPSQTPVDTGEKDSSIETSSSEDDDSVDLSSMLRSSMCTSDNNVVPEALRDNSSSHELSGLITTTSDFAKETIDSAEAEEMDKRTSPNQTLVGTVGKKDSSIETSSSEDDDIVDLSSNSDCEVSAVIQSQDLDIRILADQASDVCTAPDISMVKDNTPQNNYLVTLRSDSENSECEVVGNVLTLKSDSESSECEFLDGINATVKSQGKNSEVKPEECKGNSLIEKNFELSSSCNGSPSTQKRCSVNSPTKQERKFSPIEPLDSFCKEIHQDKSVESRNQKKILSFKKSDIEPANSAKGVVSIPDKTLLVKESTILRKDSFDLSLDNTNVLENKKKCLNPGELDHFSSTLISSPSTPCLKNVARVLDEVVDEETHLSSTTMRTRDSSSQPQKMPTKHQKKISRKLKPLGLPSFLVSPLNFSIKKLPSQRLNSPSDKEFKEHEKDMFSKCRKKVINPIKKSKTLPVFLISPLKVAREPEKRLSMRQCEESSSETEDDRFTRRHKKILNCRKSKTLPSFSVSPIDVAIEPEKRISQQKLKKSHGEEIVESSSEEGDTFPILQSKPFSPRKPEPIDSCSLPALIAAEPAKQVPMDTTSRDKEMGERSHEPEKESLAKCQKKDSRFAQLETLQARLISSLNSSYEEEVRSRSERLKVNNAEEVDELSSEPEEEPFLDEMVLGENEVADKTENIKRLNRKENRPNADKSASEVQKKPEVQIDPTKFVVVNTKRLKTKLPDLVEAGDEGIDDDDDDTSYKMTIAEAFADDDVLDEFKAEKKRIVDEDKPKDVDLFLPGWGAWGGQGIKPSRRKRRRFTLKAPDAPPRKDGTLGNVIINERKDLKAAQHQVSELPFPFNTVRDYESSIRQPLGNTWNPETSFRQLIVPKVSTRLGAIIDPIDGDALKAKPKRRKQKYRKTTKNATLNRNSIEI